MRRFLISQKLIAEGITGLDDFGREIVLQKVPVDSHSFFSPIKFPETIQKMERLFHGRKK